MGIKRTVSIRRIDLLGIEPLKSKKVKQKTQLLKSLKTREVGFWFSLSLPLAVNSRYMNGPSIFLVTCIVESAQIRFLTKAQN